MKVLLVIVLALAAAASMLAFGPTGVSAGVAAATTLQPTEPTTMLLSGSAMLALGSVIRRFMI